MQAKLSGSVRRYLENTRNSQQALAEACGVSQSCISRIVSNEPQKASPGYRKVCNFMQNQGYLGQPEEALAALNEVWEGTDTHDEALATLILASRKLRPMPGGGADDRKQRPPPQATEGPRAQRRGDHRGLAPLVERGG